ncbi:class I adenylate-forming enzyme family protein [Sphingomonas sp.]|uniref:class I adenylate-forming enzyme family protein n=1 Tax=Sphingomonas sp. TaxID=28214 RepID=UPI001ECEEEA8|nr:class I adenylate-forming enzyme family protein [Sphingomonas sp.]MBX3595023.1 acyl--CoA ligase [Sphingomonas sp.]
MSSRLASVSPPEPQPDDQGYKMPVTDYLAGPEWRELERTMAHGRPILAWKQRLRHVLDLCDLAPDRDDLDLIVQGDRRISFSAFHRAVAAAAERLSRLGVARGERVMMILYNCPEILLLQWAAFRIGAVPVFGNRWWSEREAAGAIARIRPALVVTDLDLSESMTGAEAPTRLHPADLSGWWHARVEGPVDDPRPHTHEDDLAAIVFTAGSTGAPKGVQLSHRILIWSQQTFHILQNGRAPIPDGPGGQRVSLMTTPMFHNGALVTGIANLIDGNRMVLLEGKFRPEEALALIERERITAWQAVPTMFMRLMQHPDFDRYDTDSLVAPSSGGMHISDTLLAQVRARLPAAADRFASGYGMTEHAFITLTTLPQIVEKGGTVGKAIPGVEVRIADPDATGQGELHVRSAALMIGYWETGVQPIDAEGWYATGDLARIDPDGFIFITGRAKDMIIRGGENISCAHVEAAMLEHPCVAEIAVVGTPDEQLGETVVAFVRLRPDTVATADELSTFARERLAYFCVPREWRFEREPLPVLATGKLDKVALTARAASVR